MNFDTGTVDEKLVNGDKVESGGMTGGKGEGTAAYVSDTGLWDKVSGGELKSAG